mgnify:FL=1
MFRCQNIVKGFPPHPHPFSRKGRRGRAERAMRDLVYRVHIQNYCGREVKYRDDTPQGNVSACAKRASMRGAGIRTSLCIRRFVHPRTLAAFPPSWGSKKSPGLAPGGHTTRRRRSDIRVNLPVVDGGWATSHGIHAAGARMPARVGHVCEKGHNGRIYFNRQRQNDAVSPIDCDEDHKIEASQ